MAQSGLQIWQRRLVNLAIKQEKQLGYSSNRLLLCPLVKRLQICNGEQRYWNFKPECSYILSQHLRCIVCCVDWVILWISIHAAILVFCWLMYCFFCFFFFNVSFNRQIRLHSWKANTFWSLEQALDFKMIL